MNTNENLGKKRKYAILIVKMGSVFMNIGIILPYCILAIITISFQRRIYNNIIGVITTIPLLMVTPLLVSGFLFFLIGLLSFVLFLIGLLKKTNENLKNAMVEFGCVLMKSNIITLFYYALQAKETATIPFISLAVPLYIGMLPFVSGFLLLLIGLLIDLIGQLKKSARKANENLEKKKKNARVIVEIGFALMSSSILLLTHDFYNYEIFRAFHNSLDGERGAGFFMMILIEELIFVLGFILLLIVLLVGLIGRLKNFDL